MSNRGELVACERCGRHVAPDAVWTLNANLPPNGVVQRQVCVVCAAEVRRMLLATPAALVAAEAEPPVEFVEPSRGARFGWFVTRWAVYAAVAVVAFAVVTWLAAR